MFSSRVASFIILQRNFCSLGHRRYHVRVLCSRHLRPGVVGTSAIQHLSASSTSSLYGSRFLSVATTSSVLGGKDACWESMNETTRKLADAILSKDGNDEHSDFTKPKIKGSFSKRYALSKAITLMESKHPQRKQQGDFLLTYLLLSQHDDDDISSTSTVGVKNKNNINQHPPPEDNNTTPTTIPKTLRVGFAGPPGAGKSSLMEAFGMYVLNDQNHDSDSNIHLAVVCIDPSSGVSGGSILGDKTRMTELSRHDRAYVRPSSNSGVLGGLSAYTDDVVTTLSVAGYPYVFVETVGLGQSEVEVFESVDILVLLLPPGGGDELQGVKKGIVERAHILAVTKADGRFLESAKATASDYRNAIRVLQQSNTSTNEESWQPRILLTSSVTKDGLHTLWQTIQDCRTHLIQSGKWETKRKEQARYWMWKQFTRMMQHRMQQDQDFGRRAEHLESELLKGHVTPRVAAQELLDSLFERMGQSK